jgi:hypothetical protein
MSSRYIECQLLFTSFKLLFWTRRSLRLVCKFESHHREVERHGLVFWASETFNLHQASCQEGCPMLLMPFYIYYSKKKHEFTLVAFHLPSLQAKDCPISTIAHSNKFHFLLAHFEFNSSLATHIAKTPRTTLLSDSRSSYPTPLNASSEH